MLLLSLSNIRIQPLILMVLVSHAFVFSKENIPTKNTKTQFHIESDVKESHLLLAALEQESENKESIFHFFSHGRSGELLINGEWLNALEIVKYLQNDKQYSNSNSKYLNLYGCEFAKGKKGKQAVAYLEKILNVKVAASTNITGKNGDWLLEVGNTMFSGLQQYSFNLQCANQGTADDQDYDCDGVINSDDLDDDNDGILDTDEGMVCRSASKVNLTAGLAPGNHDMDTHLASLGIRIRHVETQGYTTNTDYFRVIGHTSWTQHGDPDSKMIWNGTGVSVAYYDVDGVTKLSTNSFAIWSDPIPTPTRVRVIARDVNGNTLIDRLDVDGTEHKVDLSMTGGVPIHELIFANGSSAIDLVSLEGKCSETDTDNDGFSNHLDVDSDNDGCPDAIEAEGGFVQNNLTDSFNLADSNEGAVDSNGVPSTDANAVDISSSTPQATSSRVIINEMLVINAISSSVSNPLCVGDDITYTASASGTRVTDFTTNPYATTALAASEIRYQWYESRDSGANFSILAGETTTVLSLANVQVSVPAKQYKLKVTSENNSCPEERVLTLEVNPLPTADAGLDQSTDCTTTGVVIGAAAVTGYSYSWSPIAGLTDATSANPTASPSETVTYTLTITDTATGCTDDDEVVVTVNARVPNADAGLDQTIDCRTTSVVIGTAGDSGHSYSWSPIAYLTDVTSAMPTATPIETTNYTLTVTDTLTGCVKTDEVEVIVANGAVQVEVGEDQTVNCTTRSVEIGGASIVDYSYLWEPSDSLSDATISNPVASPLVTTEYTLVVTNNETGCTDTGKVTVSVNTTAPVADAGLDFEKTCDTNILGKEIGAEAVSGYSYSWLPVEGLSDGSISNPIANPTETTTYEVTVTDTVTGCIAKDTVVVTVNTTLPTADAGTDFEKTCTLNPSGKEIGSVSISGYSYSWLPVEGLSDAMESNPTANPSETTEYTLTIVNEETGCTNTDTVVVTVSKSAVTAEAGDDQTIACAITSVTIGSVGVEGYSYLWSPATGLSDATVASPTASPEETTSYMLTVSDNATGCSSSDSVTVLVSDPEVLEIRAPDALTFEGCAANATTITALNSGFAYSETTVELTASEVAHFLTLENTDITASCDYTISYFDSATGNCPIVVTRTYTIRNNSEMPSSDTQQLTLEDTTAPMFTSIVAPTLALFCESIPEAVTLTATDACTEQVNVVFSSETRVIDAANSVIERRWVATDNCGNETVATQLVSVYEAHETQNETLSLCVNDGAVDLNSLFDEASFTTSNGSWVLEDSDQEITNIFNPGDFEAATYVALSEITDGSCTLERRVSIRVHRECIYVPCISDENAISVSTLVTPDGDMVNDKFAIDIPINSNSTDACDIGVRLKIYNRWGALIYEDMNYQNDWTGAAARDAVGAQERTPRSTYYYIIELTNSGIAPIQGYFLLGTPN